MHGWQTGEPERTRSGGSELPGKDDKRSNAILDEVQMIKERQARGRRGSTDVGRRLNTLTDQRQDDPNLALSKAPPGFKLTETALVATLVPPALTGVPHVGRRGLSAARHPRHRRRCIDQPS